MNAITAFTHSLNQYAQVAMNISTDQFCTGRQQYCSEITLLVQTKYAETSTRLDEQLSKLDEARLQEINLLQDSVSQRNQ